MEIYDLKKIAEDDYEAMLDSEKKYEQYEDKVKIVVDRCLKLNNYALDQVTDIFGEILREEKIFIEHPTEGKWTLKNSDITIFFRLDEQASLSRPYCCHSIILSRGGMSNVFRLITKFKHSDLFIFVNEYQKHISYFKKINNIHDLRLVNERLSKLFTISSHTFFLDSRDPKLQDYLYSFNGKEILPTKESFKEFFKTLLDQASCLK